MSFPTKPCSSRRLTKTNYLFRRAASRYDTVNRQIFRIESEEELTADEVLERVEELGDLFESV